MSNWLKSNLSKLKNALFKTKAVLEEDSGFGIQDSGSGMQDIESAEITENFFEDLEERLIKADVGFDLAENIVKELKKIYKTTGQQVSRSELNEGIKKTIKELIRSASPKLQAQSSPINLFLVVGVNGSGKTTSIGKLAKRFKDEGSKVLIVAADTFRAAAGEQLNVWAERAGVEIFAPQEIKKPDAVVFSALEKAKKENYNLLLIDTAGRLHSQVNLMEELKKIDSIIEKNAKDLNKEKLIVLDATIGQNAITQAELFSKAIGLTGIVLSKLDSSAKGGVVLNIMDKLSLPVKSIGTGEKIEDIVDFNFDEYLDGLLS